MQINISPADQKLSKCLVLVGGSGDTSEGFVPLVKKLLNKITDYAVCTFSFSTLSATESLLDIQSRELEEVFSQLISNYNFTELNIFATSMGAYAAINLLNNEIYSHIIKHVIFYDPADYYVSAKFAGSNDSTWSGSDMYRPNKEVISNRLKSLKSSSIISVVHLTLKNYSKSGYFDKDFTYRGVDHESGYPRLNKHMVKHFYSCIPVSNRGKYIKEASVPHAILRDGDIISNLDRVTSTIATLLSI